MFAFLLILACNDKPADSGDPPFDPSTWEAGDFDFQTVAADDECLGGALEALFMPDGPATPHDFEYPIRLPGYDDVPVSYTVDLRAPFLAMPVTVDSEDGVMFTIRGALMEAVELGYAAYGDCTVTMSVDADLTPQTKDEVTGSATITITNPRGEDGRCPVFDVEPCTVDLTLTATRGEG